MKEMCISALSRLRRHSTSADLKYTPLHIVLFVCYSRRSTLFDWRLLVKAVLLLTSVDLSSIPGDYCSERTFFSGQVGSCPSQSLAQSPSSLPYTTSGGILSGRIAGDKHYLGRLFLQVKTFRSPVVRLAFDHSSQPSPPCGHKRSCLLRWQPV